MESEPASTPNTPQSKGGLTRAEVLSPEQRSEIARKAAQTRWSADIPKAITKTSPLKIGDTEIACAVLEDETRVFTQNAFLQAIGRVPNPSQKAIAEIPVFLRANNLKPFISEDLIRSLKPIIFRPLGGGGRQTVEGGKGGRGYAIGYKAETLRDVCRVFVKADGQGKLKPRQIHIAQRCDQLLRALEGIAITALIDEATGYQAFRDRDALQRILEAYINPELVPLPWTRRFPDEFYRELFRLQGWQYSPPQLKRPKILGNITAKLVYRQLPPGVWEELKRINPIDKKGNRRHKNWRFLTEHIGNPHLEKQLVAVITLMRSADNWGEFERLFSRAFRISPEQRQLELQWPQVAREIV
jgi:hypothetical protein